ncbi:hypothetical protein KKG29_04100 [Patescibacteria group bacterium]|nr:hypothetical protein [Patescibacteria group bacterium]MBU4000326.1 hypothetical protein [Patescibacteria group bacterium]MBU4056691.1 hypothetical protein [Patescibacteria group bacterium]MBU4368496.1 hypothetical protein [Patescibacteria group bacterium]
MSVLEKFFDSRFLIRVLKLFILNSESGFTPKEAARKIRAVSPDQKTAIGGLLRRLISVSFLSVKKSAGKSNYRLNPNFFYLPEIRKLVLKEIPMADKRISGAIRKIGGIKFAVAGGALIGGKKSPADLLVVGDGMNKSKIKKTIQNLEAESGKELSFAAMDTKEFNYRYDLYDRFIMTMLDEPNVVIVNKLKIGR